MAMRRATVDDYAALRQAILTILGRWGGLPESDVRGRLPPPQLARLESGMIGRLADEGLIEVRMVGDERVLRLTDRGRAVAEGR
jgi:hypothetical protein